MVMVRDVKWREQWWLGGKNEIAGEGGV